LAGVYYQVFKIADEPAKSRLEPAPVFAANGDALHLYFEIASEDSGSPCCGIENWKLERANDVSALEQKSNAVITVFPFLHNDKN
jgi:hypothetical protein